MLEISLLGGLNIEENGQPVTGLASRKAEVLLAYLICTGEAHARETLADLLWDERPHKQGLANLRAVLTSLRKHLPAYLSIERHTVALNFESTYCLDTAEFTELLAAAQKRADAEEQFAKAIGLYRGDFLEGVHVRESRGLEDWMLLERERLRLRAAEALHSLSAQGLVKGDYKRAAEYGRRLVALDPLRESAQRLYMLLLARDGQHNAALAQYTTLKNYSRPNSRLNPPRQPPHSPRASAQAVQHRPPTCPLSLRHSLDGRWN